MRELKFRAVNTETGEIVNDIRIDTKDWHVYADNDAMSCRARSKHWVLDQFTGLKDTTGYASEAFENDRARAVTGAGNIEGVIVWDSDFSRWSVKGDNGKFYALTRFTDFEVIGNIHTTEAA